MKTETKQKEIVRQTGIERGREMRERERERERENKNEGVREKCATVESKR